ncbi:adenosylcobinamide-GDP ribazoletransferase [Sciscionella marina]|uniref:adenosylcobinamide-GDP ribazoletransferase n=1 Tax=Sciscionella marina TaxID=508770 RepID=UPI0003652BA3
MIRGSALALSMLTVLPVRARSVDRAAGRAAIALAPLVGLLLGAILAGAAFGLRLLGAPEALAGLLAVALGVLGTRGMHIDGLADATDGLGCYGGPERALEVMRDGSTGPFAVVALVVDIGAQAVCFGALATVHDWPGILAAVTAGRAAFTIACARGIPAARADGLGSLVAGGQHPVVPVLWWLVLAAAGAVWSPWLGVTLLVTGCAVLGLVRHCVRRFGGITGDVLGACCELAVLLTAVGAVLAAH